MHSLNLLNPFYVFAKLLNFSTTKKNKLHAISNSSKALNGGKLGKVYLVGAGVGDPELLTLKAHRILQIADVILIDWLVNPDLYEYFPKGVERIFVGKKCGKHSMKQDDICDLILQQAQLGKTVVRLKGGDPSIFGRLAEETDILSKHNIDFAVVPGVTAASGCAAYAGIPLTHRDCAQSVRFVTASLKDEHQEANWRNIAHEQDTLVFYMGLSRVVKIAERLVEYGMRANMPIAIVDRGTLNGQQVCCSSLANIENAMQAYKFVGPAIIIVGEVVNKRQVVELDMLLMTEKQLQKAS
jgi:uroporphyrin-III C-methyltransferase